MTASLLPLLLPLLCCCAPGGQALPPPAGPTGPTGTTGPTGPAVREYFIAAVEIGWDYIHRDDAEPDQRGRSKVIPQKYIKAVYREYTDHTYTVPRPRPAWTGIQGPVIVAQAGEKVIVHFKNLASQPYSISPVGITYWKQSEGAGYDDSTGGQEKEDDAVSPGGYYEYVWDISPKDGPTVNDPDCLTYSYSSQVDTVRDMNSGLIGALLICKPSAFTDGKRRLPAFVLLFAVFDETKSWYGVMGERISREKFRKSNGRKNYHTINGYINSTLPGLTMCQSRDPVFWHVIGMGTAPEIHSIQFQDHSLQVLTHRRVTMEVTPMTFITAEMKPATAGRFLISCQIQAHRHDGMNALFTVEKCPDPVPVPKQALRNVKHDEEEDDEDQSDYIFNTVHLQHRNPQLQARASRGQPSNIKKHFIAAEEVTWDYAPHLKPTDSELQSKYLPAAPHHLDYKYKKVVYVEYTDASFSQRKNSVPMLLGPTLEGRVSDQIHIIFKNLASRPFNIYPNGLTKIYPLQRSGNAAENDLRSMEVLPNKTFGYIWSLRSDDGPLEGDPQCLTQLYQSTISPEQDLASGLVGTLLICKYDAIDTRGVMLGPDEKLNLIFAVFDENKSWYYKENMQRSRNTTDPDFYESNVIYSINGIMFRGRKFVMCQTDVAFWHVANVGTQSDFLSVYFTGNLFQYEGLYQSVLTLFPMTAVTVPMETELIGEWEISAFDSSLKSRGMSIRYTVRPCSNGEFSLVDDEVDEDISDYYDQIFLQPRGVRPRNGTVLVRVCKKLIANKTNSQNVTMDSTRGVGSSCELRRVPVASLKKAQPSLDAGIPEDVLEKIERDGDWAASENRTDHGGSRRKRHADGNWTEGDAVSGSLREEILFKNVENVMDTGTELKLDGKSGIPGEEQDGTASKESKDFSLSAEELMSDQVSVEDLFSSDGTDQDFVPHNHIFAEPVRLPDDLLDLDYNITDANLTQIDLSLEYTDYNDEVNSSSDLFGAASIDPRSGEIRPRLYYVAAEEISWDYGIKKPPQLINQEEMRRGMRKFLPEYKKVVFRAYRDKDFLQPVSRGELQEHLGIMGPFIRTEVNDLLTVIFRNKANRPYSFHLHGVYDRSQGAGVAQTSSSSAPPGIPGEPVPPGETRTYNWKISKKQGPTDPEFDCKTGAYYSTVDREKDLHSGLIGPLVICKSGTLNIRENTQPDMQEFSLLFHSFDETKSWYLEENLQRHCAPPCQVNPEDPWYQTSNKFAAINGYVAETLPGLMAAQHHPVRWHLLNVGGDREYHAVHFHGLPFTLHAKEEHRMGVFNLFPGVFGTVEMRPPTVGTWLVECTIGDYQLAGMRAKLLVYSPQCFLPLGMTSGRIEDSQITASDHLGYWEPRLARLDQSGIINAWMGKNMKSWLQVDLQRPTLLHGVETQGVRSRLRDHFITLFTVSYSLDQETWATYRGNASANTMIFHSNMDSYRVKQNKFSPPFVARYVRIHPHRYTKKPAVRLELLGCDLNSCSMPLGLQKKMMLIPDSGFSASSVHSSLLRTWSPSLARLHQSGGANAWRPKSNNPHEWLQVDLGKVRRITGVITQGARSLGTQMVVTEFSVTYSHDGHFWSSVFERKSQTVKIFPGNNDPDKEALTVFSPPLFGRFVRIHPRGWLNDIALRLEVLGCDTLQSI
ncbi:coagulation factor VIII [Kryptolebias marmoratus]|uniref:Coagulation factor VIII-like n=1 Tax=Kryptolebias marmoratus TaxID=37003 RepID=A0A3Q3GM99_KRYMA|nr:coagulation factor VIII [Kryptolebias marmoratus]